MIINGVEIVNLHSFEDKGNTLYQCLVIKDKQFLGTFKQQNSYSDYFSFDRTVLKESMEGFKKSPFYQKNIFKMNDELYDDFYNYSMFMNDLIDICLDEMEFKQQKKHTDFNYFIIAEDFIDNRVVFSIANEEDEIMKIKQKIKEHFKTTKHSIRIYQSLDDFVFENRYVDG